MRGGSASRILPRSARRRPRIRASGLPPLQNIAFVGPRMTAVIDPFRSPAARGSNHMRSTGKRHIISLLLQNEVGALTRVAGLFSTRGYNIESLNVAPTDDPTVSRLTLVTTGTEAVVAQIVNQSLKLVDVVNVDDLTSDQ